MSDDACPDCAAAAIQVWGGQRSSCPGCQARALSRSPDFDESARSGVLAKPYRRALQLHGLEHTDVLAARDIDFQARPIPKRSTA